MIVVDLAQILEQRQMSLAELARRVGVTTVNLSLLKNNHARAIRFSTLDAICRALECSPGEILRWEEGPQSDGA